MLAARRLSGDAPAGPTLPFPAMGTSSCPRAVPLHLMFFLSLAPRPRALMLACESSKHSLPLYRISHHRRACAGDAPCH